MPRKPRSQTSGRRDTPRSRAAGHQREERTRHPDAGTGIWLYGKHPVESALLNPDRPCIQLMATRDALETLDTAAKLALRQIPAAIMDREELDMLLPPGSVHQGFALQVRALPAIGPEDVVAKAKDMDSATVLILDQVTDPHNVGAIIRSAAAFGALAVIIQDRHSPEETGTLAKSASGALERMPLIRVSNLVRAMSVLKDGGFWIAGLTADAPSTLPEARLSGKVALTLGSEGSGLRRLTRENCDILTALPMSGAVESLNVSNAAAVALYELFRTQTARTV